MQEHNRLVGEGTETRVEMRDEVSNTTLKFVFLCGLERDLYEDNLSEVFGVLSISLPMYIVCLVGKLRYFK